MKTRNGFVSNSSSSSFVVLAFKPDEKIIARLREQFGDTDEFLVDGSVGEMEFGWQVEKYSDFWSKLHFAWLQAKYVEKDPKYDYAVTTHPEWMAMLEQVLKDNLNVKTIVWHISEKYCYEEEDTGYRQGYIDHQSSSHEGVNTEIFDSADDLARFLFNGGSYIQGGNDNI